MNRRDFLKKSFIWLLGVGFWSKLIAWDIIPELDWEKWVPWELWKKELSWELWVNIPNDFVENTKSNVENIISANNWNFEIKRSIELIWKYEVNFFKSYFNIKNSKEFVNKVKEIQEKFWLNQDGRIWEKTLKVIYLNFYSKNINLLPSGILFRLEAYYEMLKYHEKCRIVKWKKICAKSIPNVFNKNYYYWKLWTESVKDTFIDISLYNHLPSVIDLSWNHAFLQKFWNKYIVVLYIDWKLKLASYSSPWIENPKKEAIETPKWDYLSTWGSKYWISWAKVSAWAPMPDAIYITWWIFAHAWYVDWNKRSHGCIRLPKKYSKWMYKFFKKYWNIHWHIFTDTPFDYLTKVVNK